MASTKAELTSTPTTVLPLCAMTAAMGAPSLPKPMIDIFMRACSFLPDNRHTPAGPECPRGDFEHGRCLLPLELRHADEAQHPSHGCLVESLRDDLFRRLALL